LVDNNTKNNGKKKEFYQFDAKDKKIMAALAQDARMSIADISRKVGLKRDSVSYRIARMQESNTIRFSCIADYGNMGFSAQSLLILTLENFNLEKENQLKQYLEQSKEVVEYTLLSGKNDFIIKIISDNQDGLNVFIRDLRGKFSSIIKEMEINNIVSERKKNLAT
jgi:DNA-binding Lrp family transcriptional regulator